MSKDRDDKDDDRAELNLIYREKRRRKAEEIRSEYTDEDMQRFLYEIEQEAREAAQAAEIERYQWTQEDEELYEEMVAQQRAEEEEAEQQKTKGRADDETSHFRCEG